MVMDKRQILLIDDERDKCEIFLKALEKMPDMFKCSYASTTNEAVRRTKKMIPDFIFCNLSKPGDDDLICVKAIKKVKSIRHIPFYLYSSAFNEHTSRKAFELGVSKCIKKPKDVRTLTKMLKVLFYESMRAEIRNYAPRKNEQ